VQPPAPASAADTPAATDQGLSSQQPETKAKDSKKKRKKSDAVSPAAAAAATEAASAGPEQPHAADQVPHGHAQSVAPSASRASHAPEPPLDKAAVLPAAQPVVEAQTASAAASAVPCEPVQTPATESAASNRGAPATAQATVTAQPAGLPGTTGSAEQNDLPNAAAATAATTPAVSMLPHHASQSAFDATAPPGIGASAVVSWCVPGLIDCACANVCACACVHVFVCCSAVLLNSRQPASLLDENIALRMEVRASVIFALLVCESRCYQGELFETD
jgi:hypothetical protein